MSKFSWLHLSDLHWGLRGQYPLYPNVREKLFEDLEREHKKTGPWNVVLFSGDFVQKGNSREFDQLNEKVLGPLFEHLESIGSQPVLLGVPGNHDLSRPNESAARKILTTPGMFHDVAVEFWENEKSEYRKLITKAFASYSKWWHGKPWRNEHEVEDGLLPGEFSTTFLTEDNKKIGILGLNSTFLQLTSGDYTGRLVVDVQQTNSACGGDCASWISAHDVCILMTHQGPDWYDQTTTKRAYGEINPAGKFALHIFGHMHESQLTAISTGGGKVVRKWQSPSLFGMEHFGKENQERRHGYSHGQIVFENGMAEMRIWPRFGVYHEANGWKFIRDEQALDLEDDGGTGAVEIQLKKDGGASQSDWVRQYNASIEQAWHERWSGEISDDEI